jgi:hypothetical protein
VGIVVNDYEGKFTKNIALVTSDGGANWTQIPLKERPRSLFFLNENSGWMVTDDGVWFTEEAGRSWKKVSDQPKPPKGVNFRGGVISVVWFLDEKHGFAAGYAKSAFETKDGGHTWTPIAAAAEPSANPLYSVYTRIVFAPDGKRGLIIGGYAPPRAGSRDAAPLPTWMEPDAATKRRQVPTLTIVLETKDAGATWQASTAPLFGTVATARLTDKEGLTVFLFNEAFEWPAEVYRIDLSTGKSVRVYREKDRRVTDALLFPGPKVVLAAVEPPGKLNTAPIPGRVRIITGSNFSVWYEAEVDYKAQATRVRLAGPDPEHLWVATDTGMILHLTK